MRFRWAVALLVTMVVLDFTAFSGRYSTRVWNYAEQTGLSFHYEISRMVSTFGS